jgi:hypothetical protein
MIVEYSAYQIHNNGCTINLRRVLNTKRVQVHAIISQPPMENDIIDFASEIFVREKVTAAERRDTDHVIV